MSYQTLIVERRGPVGWLIFNRPKALNAMNATMMGELELAWRELDADPEVRVIVNAGEGSAFQTGVDVVQIAKDKDALRKFSRQTRDAQLAFTAWHLQIHKPVIAKVQGNLDCNDGELLHRWASEGLGLAWRSTWEIQAQLASGELVTVLDEYALPHYDIMAVYPQQRHLPAKTRFFIDYLKDVYGQQDYWNRARKV